MAENKLEQDGLENLSNDLSENTKKNDGDTIINSTKVVNDSVKPKLRVWTEDIEITQHKTIKRLTFGSLFYQLAEAFNLDKGFFYTLKGLTIRPAETIREYLDTKRHLVMNPVKYFLMIVGTTLLIATQTGYFEASNDFERGLKAGGMDNVNTEKSPEIEELTEILTYAYSNYFIKYQNIWFIITILFTSFFTYLFYKKSGFNFIEHNVINGYVFIHTYLFFAMMVIFDIHNDILSLVYMAFYTIAAIVVFKHLFKISWWKSTWKTLLAFMSSLFVFYLIIFVFGIIWALMYHKK